MFISADLDQTGPPNLCIDKIGQELDGVTDPIGDPHPRELTSEEDREVNQGWTTPASRRARDNDR